MQMLEPETNSREDFKLWTAVPSDVEVEKPTTHLSSDQIPILCILDSLCAAGFEGKEPWCMTAQAQASLESLICMFA